MLMSFGALAVMSVFWVVAGYSLAFSLGTSWLGDLAWTGLRGVGGDPNATYSAGIPHVLFAAYQMMFAGITVALISGAVVERMRFPAFLLFSLLWGALVYVPLAHWVWADGGWLRSLGALDFAEPALKPNQPNQRMPAPSSVNGTLCGRIAVRPAS